MAEVGASTCLTLREIENELSEVTGADWYPLGVQLGLRPPTLREILNTYPHDTERCKQEVLHIWLCSTPEASWKSLAQAVQALGRYESLAQKLRRKVPPAGKLSSTSSDAHGSNASTESGHSVEEESTPAVKCKCVRDEDITTQGELSSMSSDAHGRDASTESRHSVKEESAPAVKRKCIRDEDITAQDEEEKRVDSVRNSEEEDELRSVGDSEKEDELRSVGDSEEEDELSSAEEETDPRVQQETLLREATKNNDIDSFHQHLDELERLLSDDDMEKRLIKESVLCYAAHLGSTPIVEALIEKCVDINIMSTVPEHPVYYGDEMSPLHWAADGGHVDTVKFLIEKGADVNCKDNEGDTPLHMAARNGHTDAVQCLIDKGAGINIKNNGGYTPLHVAAEGGHTDSVQYLIDKGAGINVKNNRGMTPLHRAAQGDHVGAVELLLQKGADVTIKDVNGMTPLHRAAQGDHVGAVELLLQKGADVTIKDVNGATPLHDAAQGGHVVAVELLLQKGADITIKDVNGWTPLHEAAIGGHGGAVELLLQAGGDVNVKDDYGMTPLHCAANGGHVGAVEYLIQGGVDVNIKDDIGWTPLHTAAEGGHGGAVELLLHAGADFNIQDNGGCNPLHRAALEGKEGTIHLLVEKGADMNIKDIYGWAPLHKAAIAGREGTVQLLVEKGANMNIKDSDGMTPLHWAAEEGKEGTVQLLIEKGTDINVKTSYGMTPLHIAAIVGKEGTVQLLIEKGADINIKDSHGWTPLHYAADEGTEGTVQLLIKKGADINIKDNDGITPLVMAAARGHEAVVAYLKRAADPNMLEESESTGRQQEQRPSLQETALLFTDNSPSEEPPATTEKEEEREESDHEEIDLQVKKLLEKYHHQPKIKHKSLKCLFTGPPRVGKTTLKKRLLKTIKNLITSGVVSPSGGLEKPISVIIGETRECVTVVMESDFDWQPQHDLLDEAQIVLEFIDKSHQSQPTSHPTTVLPKPVSPTPFPAPAMLSPATPAATTAVPSKSSPDSPTPREGEADTLEDAKKLMQEVLSSRKLRSIKDIEKTTTLYLMDTGGQPEFHEIMPIILNGPALHLIFFNLAFDLNEPIPIEFFHQDGTDSITYVSSYTGKQMIFQLLSSLYYFTKSLSPDSEPAAVLIGTHLDQLKGDDEMKVNGFLNQLFTNTEFHNQGFLTYPTRDKSTIFTPVNNYSGDEEEIHRLQAFLKRVIHDRFSPVELPSSWLFFHLLLRHRYENSPGVCKLTECRALAKGCGLDEDDVPQVLRYIHQHLGTILFYEDVPGLNELVICDPNVLFKGIYQLVAVSFGGDKGYHTITAEIRKTGEIHAKVLKRISTQSSSSLLKNEHIIELLMHFKILTKLPSDDGVIYFMPCLLRLNNSLELSCKALQTLYPPPLLVRFKGNYIPMGVFSALVVKLLESSWELDQDKCYRNHIVFNMDDDFSVELIVHPAYLEFRIRISNPTEEDAEEIHQFCMMVCKTVVDTLISVLDLHAHTKKAKFQLGFYCSGSLQADGQPHFCRLSNQSKINPKTFASSDSPHCQDQCCLPPQSTIWLEQWKNKRDTRDQGHACVESVDDITVLDEDDLHDVISAVTDLAGRWQHLGIALRLRSGDLESILSASAHSPSDCLRKLLTLWLKQNYNVKKLGNPTWRRLVEAVEDPVGGNDHALAQKIAAKHPAVKSGN